VVGVATRDVFSEQELARLRGFPEITRAELIRYFTLTSADEGFVGRFLGQRNVLGASVQLCTLPWLGFVPDDVSSAPPEAVARLAERLGVASAQLRGYGERAQTRTDHLREVLRYAGWRLVGAPEWKQLDEFLIARAMEHDSPRVLLGSVCEYLISERVVRPGVVLLLEHVAAARERARRETWTLLAPQLADAARRMELDGMLVVDPALGGTPLAWLEAGPTSASPAVVKTELAKLPYLRGLDAHTLDLSVLPAQRRRFLAGLGRRLTAQALARRDQEDAAAQERRTRAAEELARSAQARATAQADLHGPGHRLARQVLAHAVGAAAERKAAASRAEHAARAAAVARARRQR